MTERLAYLYERYRQKSCSYEELNEWLGLLQDPKARQIIEKLIAAEGQEDGIADEAKQIDWDFMFNSIMKNTASTAIAHKKSSNAKIFTLGRIVAAAVILTAISSVFYFTVFRSKTGAGIAETGDKQTIRNDIAPGGDKAVLTLADGSKIILDTAVNGAVAQQGGIKVIKLGGQLKYDVQSNSSEVLYNTITTPKGGQYQLELADGSKVWLNSASSFRYPTTFAGKERRVEVRGEAYFEVAKNPTQPFIVSSGSQEIKVLGTHFNINAYEDEGAIRTTLLEGSVKITAAGKGTVISPGEQSVVINNNIGVEKVNVNDAVAWKNGYFSFRATDIKGIMRQLSRWYDVDVEYQGIDPNETFTGKIERKLTLSQVLKVLEDTKVSFRIENGKKLVILP